MRSCIKALPDNQDRKSGKGQQHPNPDPYDEVGNHKAPQMVIFPVKSGRLYYTNTQQEPTSNAIEMGKNEQNSGGRFRDTGLPVRFVRPSEDGKKN